QKPDSLTEDDYVIVALGKLYVTLGFVSIFPAFGFVCHMCRAFILISLGQPLDKVIFGQRIRFLRRFGITGRFLFAGSVSVTRTSAAGGDQAKSNDERDTGVTQPRA